VGRARHGVATSDHRWFGCLTYVLVRPGSWPRGPVIGSWLSPIPATKRSPMRRTIYGGERPRKNPGPPLGLSSSLLLTTPSRAASRLAFPAPLFELASLESAGQREDAERAAVVPISQVFTEGSLWARAVQRRHSLDCGAYRRAAANEPRQLPRCELRRLYTKRWHRTSLAGCRWEA